MALRCALWVWQPSPTPDLLAFARQHRFTDLYLQWSPSLDHAKLRAFIRAAYAQNIRVYALDGSPQAALEKYHPSQLKEVAAIAAFNEGSSPVERLAGIHLDIEPYLLPGFDGPQKTRILSGYTSLQREIAGDLSLHKRAVLTYGVDLPFWFDLDTVRQVLEFVDYIAIMDYRDHALGDDGIVAHALPILHLAEKLHKQVFVGIETCPNPIRGVSFAEKTPQEVETEIETVIRELSNQPAFAGIAIHDFEHYRALLNRKSK